LASPLSRGTFLATVRPPGEAFVRMAATLFTLQHSTDRGTRAPHEHQIGCARFHFSGRPWHARSWPQVGGARNNHEAENESDPPGLSPASNSNGSLPWPRLPEVSKWTSKFLNMFVNRKEIYMEFMRAPVEFIRRLRDGLNGEADER
jgi:hypothetical protein